MSKVGEVIVTVVHWLDAAYIENGARDTGLLGCCSCGIILEEDEQVLVIALMLFDHGVAKHCLSIPKCQIIKRKDTTFSREKVR